MTDFTSAIRVPAPWPTFLFAALLVPVLSGGPAGADGPGAMNAAQAGAPRGAAPDARAWRKRSRGRILIVAHRGFSAIYTENSRAGFEAAIKAGADLIETDIRESRDGVLVCVHDREVDGHDVKDLTWKQLAKRSVLRLSDVLKIAQNRVGVLLDIKIRDTDFPLRVFEEVKRLGLENQVVFGLRRNSQVRALRRGAPDVVILGFLKNYKKFSAFYRAGGDIARLWEEDINETTLALARGPKGADRPVWVTAGLRDSGEDAGDIDAKRFLGLMKQGFDGVLVNDPALARGARRSIKVLEQGKNRVGRP
ncbi:MAG: glycerophosphodiester phosphodiesterase family protein [Alphaproteobacteria bacterium]|nr:glycerophosphodiester phosphodiesterase family protein [Alphaproteobacteria bacterium]